MKCEPRGFKVKVTDAKKAAEFALQTVLRRRELLKDEAIAKATKRWFFRDRTPEEALAYITKYSEDWPDWQVKGWGIEEWAKELLQALEVVDDEHIWVNSNDASNIGNWSHRSVSA